LKQRGIWGKTRKLIHKEWKQKSTTLSWIWLS
jgi:hypothetical protein